MERGGDLLNKKNAIDHNETLIFSIFMGCNTACECRFAHQTVAICVHKCTSLTLTRGSLAQIRKSPTKSGDPMAHHFISNGLWPHTSSSCFVIAQCSNESFKAVWRSNSPSSKEKKKKKINGLPSYRFILGRWRGFSEKTHANENKNASVLETLKKYIY